MEGTKVLVVDDYAEARRSIGKVVRSFGHATVECASVEEALRAFDAESFDVVLSDVKMGVLGGFDLLSSILKRAPDVPVVLITGQATLDDAMGAVRAGAFEYIGKPYNFDQLRDILRRAIEHRRLRRLEASADFEEAPPVELSSIIGRSPAMLEAFKLVARAARGDTNVLILGENGTGKEMVAQALHDNSERADRSFVAVNVAAIAAGVAESELFGHRRGAFTGAQENRTGLFEQAHGGTLFLDELGDLDLGLQVKLLRAIQERVIKPVGGNEEIEVDIRLVSATNHDLMGMVRRKEFREDLYYRINVVEISLPPLRERAEDIPLLAAHFLARYGPRSGRRKVPRLSEEALAMLKRHHWRGNVRELENVMQRAAQFCTDGIVTPDQLQLANDFTEPAPRDRASSALLPRAVPAPATRDSFVSLDEKVAEYIAEVLQSTGGNLTQAAKILRVNRRTLQRKSKVRKLASE